MRIVISFGLNDDGQCGSRKKTALSSSSSTFSLLHFPGASRVSIITLAAGSRHTLALSLIGQVYSFGWGLLGQLGLGHTMTCDSPTLVESLSVQKIMLIAAGGIHSGAVNDQGQCYMWGGNSHGQLGLGIATSDDHANKCLHPTRVHIVDDSQREARISKLALGGMHTVAIDSNGIVYCWGRADSGQAGPSHWIHELHSSITRPRKLQGLDEAALGRPFLSYLLRF